MAKKGTKRQKLGDVTLPKVDENTSNVPLMENYENRREKMEEEDAQLRRSRQQSFAVEVPVVKHKDEKEEVVETEDEIVVAAPAIEEDREEDVAGNKGKEVERSKVNKGKGKEVERAKVDKGKGKEVERAKVDEDEDVEMSIIVEDEEVEMPKVDKGKGVQRPKAIEDGDTKDEEIEMPKAAVDKKENKKPVIESNVIDVNLDKKPVKLTVTDVDDADDEAEMPKVHKRRSVKFAKEEQLKGDNEPVVEDNMERPTDIPLWMFFGMVTMAAFAAAYPLEKPIWCTFENDNGGLWGYNVSFLLVVIAVAVGHGVMGRLPYIPFLCEVGYLSLGLILGYLVIRLNCGWNPIVYTMAMSRGDERN